MKLRARTKQGAINVGEKLDSNKNTISDLYEDLKSVLGFKSVSLVKYGFPLKPLQGDCSTLLKETGLKDGDVLVVEGLLSSTAPAAGPDNNPKIDNNTMQTNCGHVLVRKMLDDNSCLFRSIAYLFLKNSDRANELRKVVADEILKSQLIYNEAILGKDPKSYCDWILKLNSWGGAIELAIFSDYFQTCIISLDVSSGRLDKFGETKYPSAAFVLYSGIHYDAIVVSPNNSRNSSDEFDISIFSHDKIQLVEEKVILLGHEWKKQRRYTDLGSFTIKCGICSVGLKGQKEAQEHAISTGHKSFVQY